MHASLAAARGDEAAARVAATKALKQSHMLLGNTQVVSGALNTLAPIQVGGGGTWMRPGGLGWGPAVLPFLHRR